MVNSFFNVITEVPPFDIVGSPSCSSWNQRVICDVMVDGDEDWEMVRVSYRRDGFPSCLACPTTSANRDIGS